MKVTVIRDDGLVGLDGLFIKLNLSPLSEDIRAIQYDSVNKGFIEMRSGANEPLANINDYKWILDAWYARRTEIIDEEKAKAKEETDQKHEAAQLAAIEKAKQIAEIAAEQAANVAERKALLEQFKSDELLNSIPKLAKRIADIERFLGLRD